MLPGGAILLRGCFDNIQNVQDGVINPVLLKETYKTTRWSMPIASFPPTNPAAQTAASPPRTTSEQSFESAWYAYFGNDTNWEIAIIRGMVDESELACWRSNMIRRQSSPAQCR
jgi:hypothetical protein